MPVSTPPSDSKQAPTDDAWRLSVQQSYRNSEVRQIARVLASLEPGASEASKLRLAMQFEDSIFKEATALADYHKRISKRLKKMQKNYKPKTEMAATKRKEQAIQELIARYGETLKYVCKHEAAAVREMRAKYGEEKGTQLQQHLDQARQWAQDLGLIAVASGDQQQQQQQQQPKPNYSMSDTHLERLQLALGRRLDTIRSHTVKLVDADLFMQEALQKCEADFATKPAAVQVQSELARRRYEQIQRVTAAHDTGATTETRTTTTTTTTTMSDPVAMLAQAMERASQPVPVLLTTSIDSSTTTSTSAPTTTTAPDSSSSSVAAIAASRTAGKNVRSGITSTSVFDKDRTKAALLHLEKMRAASTVVLAYLLAPDKQAVPKDTLAKVHRIACNGIEFVQDTMRRYRQSQPSSTRVRLEDAWLKPLELPPKDTGGDLDGSVDNGPSAPTTTTRPHCHLYLRSRVLLTKNRKTPPNLLPALQDKCVELIRPPPSGAGSHLYLELDEAFTMTIYLVPLRCELRAYNPAAAFHHKKPPQSASTSTSEHDSTNAHDEEEDYSTASVYQCATWTPLHHGLLNRDDDLVVGGQDCRGNYETVGSIVQERLRDASAWATQTLRQCFVNNTANLNLSRASDFEVEILEASALLEFLQLARDTYLPSSTT